MPKSINSCRQGQGGAICEFMTKNALSCCGTGGENNEVYRLVKNYGVEVEKVARQVRISTSGVSKILT